MFYSSSWKHFSNNLYKLFLYYWYSTKYCQASCFQTFTLSRHITINKFYPQWESQRVPPLKILIPQWSFLLTTLVAAFLVVCSILQWKMSQSDSSSANLDDEFFCILLNQLLIIVLVIFCICFDFFALTTWKNIKESY